MKLLILLSVMTASPFTYGYLPQNCTLYSDPQLTAAVTTLPATYFVIMLSEDENPKVSYKDVVGYLRNADVEVVDYEPVTKFADCTFTVNNDGYPAKLRLSPKVGSPVVGEMPDGTSGYYYGDAEGDALIDKVGVVWRYVGYSDGGISKTGYVYSSQVSVTAAPPNKIEKVEYNDKGEDDPSPVEKTDLILIVCLCVPSVLIMYMIFRGGERKPRS